MKNSSNWLLIVIITLLIIILAYIVFESYCQPESFNTLFTAKDLNIKYPLYININNSTAYNFTIENDISKITKVNVIIKDISYEYQKIIKEPSKSIDLSIDIPSSSSTLDKVCITFIVHFENVSDPLKKTICIPVSEINTSNENVNITYRKRSNQDCMKIFPGEIYTIGYIVSNLSSEVFIYSPKLTTSMNACCWLNLDYDKSIEIKAGESANIIVKIRISKTYKQENEKMFYIYVDDVSGSKRLEYKFKIPKFIRDYECSFDPTANIKAPNYYSVIASIDDSILMMQSSTANDYLDNIDSSYPEVAYIPTNCKKCDTIKHYNFGFNTCYWFTYFEGFLFLYGTRYDGNNNYIASFYRLNLDDDSLCHTSFKSVLQPWNSIIILEDKNTLSYQYDFTNTNFYYKIDLRNKKYDRKEYSLYNNVNIDELHLSDDGHSKTLTLSTIGNSNNTRDYKFSYPISIINSITTEKNKESNIWCVNKLNNNKFTCYKTGVSKMFFVSYCKKTESIIGCIDTSYGNICSINWEKGCEYLDDNEYMYNEPFIDGIVLNNCVSTRNILNKNNRSNEDTRNYCSMILNPIKLNKDDIVDLPYTKLCAVKINYFDNEIYVLVQIENKSDNIYYINLPNNRLLLFVDNHYKKYIIQ